MFTKLRDLIKKGVDTFYKQIEDILNLFGIF